MKRTIIIFLLLLNTVMLFCGCDNNDNQSDDNYNYLTDTQLANSASSISFDKCNIAKCETGYYTLVGKKIYYVENETMQATPLCSKPNCMHTDENCNAQIGAVDNICYSDGYIYFVCEADEEYNFEGSYLVKMSADGNQRENILYMESAPVDWIIHRGYFYYSVRKFRVNEDSGLENINYADCYIYSYPTNKSSEPKEIYFAQEIEKDAQISRLAAYGDNLYFDLYGMQRDNNKTEVMKTVKLNLSVYTVTEMLSPTGYSISSPMYLDGMLIFSSGESDNGKYLYYKTDFDGNNPEMFFETYEGETVICDGKYLYVDNYYALNLSQYISEDEPVNKEERYIIVYDSELKKIDEFSFGDGSAKTWNIIPIDDQVFMFAGKNDDGDLIFYYDKNEFGTLKGELWEKTFCYREE